MAFKRLIVVSADFYPHCPPARRAASKLAEEYGLDPQVLEHEPEEENRLAETYGEDRGESYPVPQVFAEKADGMIVHLSTGDIGGEEQLKEFLRKKLKALGV